MSDHILLITAHDGTVRSAYGPMVSSTADLVAEQFNSVSCRSYAPRAQVVELESILRVIDLLRPSDRLELTQ